MIKLYLSIRLVKISEVLFLCQYGIYFLVLLCMYSMGIAPNFAYMGFLDAFSSENLVISLLMLLFVVPFLRPGQLPSAFFLNLTASLILVPTLVLYTGAGLPHRFALVTTAALVLMAIISKTIRLRAFKLPVIHSSNLLLVLGYFSAFTVAGIFVFGGARFLNFDLSAVYDLRREAAQNLPIIFSYLVPLVSKVAIPFAIVFAIRDRHWLVVAGLVSLSVLLFALTAHKSPLFFPVMVIFVYFIARSRYVEQYFLAALISIVLASAIDIWFFSRGGEGVSGWFASLFTRRVLLVPSFLNWCYLDFFFDAEKYFWAESKITAGLIEPPFDLRSVNLIGLEYFGKEEMSANTGWIGSGYANAGLWGVMLYSILIGVLLAFLDSYSYRLGKQIIVALFVLPIFTIITSTDFLTMFLTHGLLLSLLLLALMNSTDPTANESLT